jgi:chromatin segregation and condensation protein Rec8/ScpA/Scc1 (kleisin family)
VVAGCFQELLFLSTHGLLELQQQKPYANIIISKAEGFDAVEVVA